MLAKAKGMAPAPFNVEGRRLAGLDDDFIRHLEVCEQSRGRTPVVYWFNPNAESYMQAEVSGRTFVPNKMELAMEHDLEMVLLAWCRRDDLLLLRTPPGLDHLAHLKHAGVEIPEIVSVEDPDGIMRERKLGGLRAWAWSPDASDALHAYAENVSKSVPWQWQKEMPQEWLSKEIGVRVSEMLELSEGTGAFFQDADDAWRKVLEHLECGEVLCKAPFACAGRGHRRVSQTSEKADVLAWLEEVIASQGGVVVEPWLERVFDFSALYEVAPGGDVKFKGMTEMENDASGRFLGTRVHAKWGRDLEPEVSDFLFREAQMNAWYRQKIPQALERCLSGYKGPVGVDAMVYRRADGSLALRHVVELNVRMTMGRIALELQKKSPQGRGGRLRILRKNKLSAEVIQRCQEKESLEAGIFLNDPEKARAFLAHWQVL
jgi:hypothetical protein